MEELGITIIGAGVVGLAIASELAREDRLIAVVEKNEKYGQETSSRNSEVSHSGIHYPPGTLKAKTCVEGNAILMGLGESGKIGYNRIGKLTVALDEIETERLEFLLEQGENNGVEGLRIIDRKEIKELEPNIEAVAALYSPTTAVINAHDLVDYFKRKAEEKEAFCVFLSEVTGIDKISDGYIVTIKEGKGERISTNRYTTRVLINCAGLNSDTIASMAGIDIDKEGYRLYYNRGEYFSLFGKAPVQHLVYPLPTKDHLGIHVGSDLVGQVKLGPSSGYADRESYDYPIDDRNKQMFYDSVRRFLPGINLDDLSPAMFGTRPKLSSDNSFRDFVIKDEADNGFPGLINLIGIDSPGLTAAPAIARYVARIVDDIYYKV